MPSNKMNVQDGAVSHEVTRARRVWVIRAGKRSSVHSLFVDHGLIALGRQHVGDLSRLPAEMGLFLDHVRQLAIRGGASTEPTSLGRLAGTFFRFIHVMHDGDIAIYPATKVEGKLYIGVVSGPYGHQPEPDPEFPHQRSVSWLKSLPRTTFSGSVLSELGAFSPFFEVKRNIAPLLAFAARRG